MLPKIYLLCKNGSASGAPNCRYEDDPTRIFFSEFFGTFLFTCLYLHLRRTFGAREDLLNALCVALGLYGIASLTQGYSGACFNPAVGIVQAVYNYLVQLKYVHPTSAHTTYDYQSLKLMWIYALAPIVAAVLAAYANIINGRVIENMKEHA